MILGFFCLAACAVAAGQYIIHSAHPAACPEELTVTRDGRPVAAYVDDSTPGEQSVQAACPIRTFAGEFGHDTGLPNGLVEWYPVAGRSTRIGRPPPPGQAGYILQAFSWGDNPEDALSGPLHCCQARYRAPSRAQLRLMWCEARARKPRAIFWYHSGARTRTILGIERRGC